MPLYLAGTVLLGVVIFFIISYVLIYSRRRQKSKLETARLKHEYEKSLFTARLEEQESAMTQISKEIHDNVAQKVDFIQMNLKGIDEVKEKELQVKRTTNSLIMLEQVTADLRNISYSLNSDYIKDRGLGEVLQKELAYIGESKGINCELHIEGEYRTLSPDKELLLYRIAQEALHNAVKYSKASCIEISLCYESDLFTMKVTDNGVGFDRDESDFINGLGFRNMKQRAELLGAELEVVAAPGHGCNVLLTMREEEPALA